ncbi:hypothetical protein M5K25_013549 [Dendrobium thyrsiflorum]|uniref:DUF4283 domain-containing protein n=1 Tax=Dendrobium thyrsiflorum TaxID=117978 RepID=A0ABD0UTJ1_DENTH
MPELPIRETAAVSRKRRDHQKPATTATERVLELAPVEVNQRVPQKWGHDSVKNFTRRDGPPVALKKAVQEEACIGNTSSPWQKVSTWFSAVTRRVKKNVVLCHHQEGEKGHEVILCRYRGRRVKKDVKRFSAVIEEGEKGRGTLPSLGKEYLTANYENSLSDNAASGTSPVKDGKSCSWFSEEPIVIDIFKFSNEKWNCFSSKVSKHFNMDVWHVQDSKPEERSNGVQNTFNKSFVDIARIPANHRFSPIIGENLDNISKDGVLIPDQQEIHQNIKKLEFALVGKILGKKLSYTFIHSELKKRWNRFGEFKFMLMGGVSFICIFSTLGARDAVLNGGPWTIAGRLMGLSKCCGLIGHTQGNCQKINTTAMRVDDGKGNSQLGNSGTGDLAGRVLEENSVEESLSNHPWVVVKRRNRPVINWSKATPAVFPAIQRTVEKFDVKKRWRLKGSTFSVGESSGMKGMVSEKKLSRPSEVTKQQQGIIFKDPLLGDQEVLNEDIMGGLGIIIEETTKQF